MLLLTVDPGVGHIGWALWSNNRLAVARVSSSVADFVQEVTIALRIVSAGLFSVTYRIERPLPVQAKAPMRDVVTLALLAGEIAGRLDQAGAYGSYVLPDWKGGIPKPKSREEYIVTTRCRKVLTPTELLCVSLLRGRKAWDLWDAIGIGLVELQRVVPGYLAEIASCS